MSSPGTPAGFPSLETPFVDAEGNIIQTWLQLLITMWNRTGQGQGFASTGTGLLVFNDGPTLVAPALGTPASGNLVNCFGLTVPGGGTGVTTFTLHGVVLGDGAGPLQATAEMLDGQLLVGQTASFPLPKTLSGDISLAPAGVVTITAGAVTEGKQTLADVVTLNVSSAAHGYTPKSPADATQFLNGAATPAFARVSSVLGTATNNNAAAGDVGEYAESEVLVGGKVATATDTNVDVTTLSLSAGDWDVWGLVVQEINGTATGVQAWINDASATRPTLPAKGAEFLASFSSAIISNANIATPVGQRRFSLATTTTVYLSTRQIITTGSNFAYGILCARRAR